MSEPEQLAILSTLGNPKQVQAWYAQRGEKCRYWYSFDFRDTPSISRGSMGWCFGHTLEEARLDAIDDNGMFLNEKQVEELKKAKCHLRAE